MPDSTAITPELVTMVHRVIMSGGARWEVDQAVRAEFTRQRQAAPTASVIDAAYAACVERWIADADQPEDATHAYHLALRKALIAGAMKTSDYPTAARIAADLAKLQDQYTTNKAARAKTPQRTSRIERLRSRKPKLTAVK